MAARGHRIETTAEGGFPEAHGRSRRLHSWMASIAGSRLAFQADAKARKAISFVVSRYRDVDEPIFLWGPGRTGSSLLYDLLSLHPDVVCYRWRQRRVKGLYGSEHWGAGGYQLPLRRPFPPQEGAQRHFGPLLARIQDGAVATEEELAVVRDGYRRLAATSVRRRRLLDKSPTYTYLVPLLDRMFPDARHVQCLRHPLAIVNGYARRMREGRNVDSMGFWGWKPDGWESLVDASIEEKAVWLVTQAIRQGMSMGERLGGRCVETRYETLVSEPRLEVARLLEHVGLRQPARLLARLPASFPNFNAEPPDLTSVDPGLCHELGEVTAALGYRK